MDDFDRELERGLKGQLGGLRGSRPRASQARYQAAAASGGMLMKGLAMAAVMASSKAAMGLALAAAVVGGGTVLASVSTHSDPAQWGKTVTAAVASCKADLTTGHHGIGKCVSAVADKHGMAEKNAHAQGAGKPSSLPGNSGNKPSGAGNAAPTGVPVGQPSPLPASQSKHRQGPLVTVPGPK